jgi:hypothetical protein
MSKHSSFASKSERCRSLDQIIARLGQGGNVSIQGAWAVLIWSGIGASDGGTDWGTDSRDFWSGIVEWHFRWRKVIKESRDRL